MTDETKANEKEPKSQELKALEQKRDKINEKIAKQKEKERKQETRRKIIVGGWLLALARTDESFQELLESRLYPTLTDARDRELFKLLPLPEPTSMSTDASLTEKPDAQDVPATESQNAPQTSQEPGPGPSKILIRFPGGKPAPDVLAALKATGRWSWNKEALCWEGEADPEAVRQAVAPLVVEIENLRV